MAKAKENEKTADADVKEKENASAKTKSEAKDETAAKAKADDKKTEAKKEDTQPAKKDTSTSNNQIVESHEDGWAVRKEGSENVTEVFDTRADAVRRARELAANQGGQVYIYREGEPATA